LREGVIPSWPENYTWYGQPHYLGGGGCGQAHLWLAVDEEEKILERIVVKDCWLDLGSWRDVNQWVGNPHDVEEREHREIHFHRSIHPNNRGEDREGSEYVARMFHAETFPEQMAYRMYLQYYPHGDLNGVCGLYVKAMKDFNKTKRKGRAKGTPRGKTRKVADTEEEEPKAPFVPEPFLWSVLEALTRACIVFEHRSTDEGLASPKWNSIVHRDIKLDNIYLDAPSDDIYQSYPQAILADLGLAIQTNKSDRRNPLDYLGIDGTETWQAPEMLPMLDRKTFRISPVGTLGAHTNIWVSEALSSRL
jgi:serine/threonine protein kinase